ncbi:hypothetical protein ACFL3Z_01005 [Gemmatimonadota bacterium]
MRSNTNSTSVRAPSGALFTLGSRVAKWRFLVLMALPALVACDEDPFKIQWAASPDTVLLYSLARPELNLLSAFDFVHRFPIRIESPAASNEWDMAVDTEDGQLVLLPPGAVGISNSKAAVSPMPGVAFDDIRKAPADTALYIRDRSVHMTVGTTYVIRTRQEIGIYGTLCVYFGKLKPISADPVAGTLTFVYDVSPACNDRNLTPTIK